MDTSSIEQYIKNHYPDDEQALASELLRLQKEWQAEVNDDDFVFDGFYPYYTHQPIRVLFIGREAYGLAGRSYLAALQDSYNNTFRIGQQHINRNPYHRRLLKLLYSMMHHFPSWKQVPKANMISRNFAQLGGISCAVVNMSKTSNETKNLQPRWPVLQKSVNDGHAFLKKEIELLAPDVIISSHVNIEPAISPHSFHRITEGFPPNLLGVGEWHAGARCVYNFETWHFSARKADSVFHEPLYQAFLRWCPELLQKVATDSNSLHCQHYVCCH